MPDLNQDYDVVCYSSAVRKQSELLAAFNRVADKANWKMPVDAVIDQWWHAIIHDAVIHFTGSVPTFEPTSNGQLHVKAAGYYQTVGA